MIRTLAHRLPTPAPLTASSSHSLILARSLHTSPISPQQSWEFDYKPKKNAVKANRTPKGTKGPEPGPEELERRAKARVQRAERLERKDLTAQLTPTKTYMGGFTQPRHLAFLNTLDPTRKPKDSYEVRVSQNRVRPAAEAYEPHCVYLAVTRYPIRWGHGRATRRECFSGFCKESELKERFKELNYGIWSDQKISTTTKEEIAAGWFCRNESKEYIDLAVWPGSPESRSLLNRQFYLQKKVYDKDQLRIKTAIEAGLTPEEPAQPPPDKSLFIPATTVENWTRPLPPHTDFPLILPLLTVTLPTRPLASTLSRLCNGHPRGLSFVASVPNEDRKDGPAFFRRLLRMRADRIRTLTGEIIEKLQGYGGGFFGLRLSPEDKGRGVEGEALGEAIEPPRDGAWAELRLLTEDSPVWEGIERERFVSDWKETGLDVGKRWTEKAEVVGMEGQEVEVSSVPRNVGEGREYGAFKTEEVREKTRPPFPPQRGTREAPPHLDI